jgi:EAL domain-containing protein (putative c-di-GMP-specific phosphodiesterase class I)/ActR/RegA family two-component response regulator
MSYRHALLVDDDPVFRALTEDMILDAGVASVEMAENGSAALQMLDAGLAPDLLVSDLNMPAHDGVSLIRSLADRKFPGKVLIISGEAPAVIDTVAKLAKMQGLDIIGSIRKPLTTEALNDVLTRSAPAKRPGAAGVAPAEPVVLEAAIDRGALIPFFQAKVCMRTCQIAGAEALARIAITHDQYANPVPYIQLAEQTDRIDDLTLTLARTVSHHVRDYRVNGEPMPVSINISPLSLTRRDFPDQLAQIIEAAGLSCTQVTLEVTETRLMDSGPDVLETMARMRIKGFGLSVDDFGTGASNIDRLQQFPFTELKIDQTFTRNVFTDSFARAAVETSVRLARELQLKIVAEGIETPEMWRYLADLGVDEGQGYLMAYPLAPTDFANLLWRGLPMVGALLRA